MFEVGVELDAIAEQPVMHTDIARRRVLEAHASWLPTGAEKLTHQAQHHTERQLDSLARGLLRIARFDLLTENDHIGARFDHQRQRTVEQHLIAHQQFERVAQGRLVANQHAHRAKI